MSWTKEPWGGGADSFKEPWASDYKPRHLPGTLAAWVAWLHAALLGASRNTGQRHCGCHSCLIRTQESRTTGFWRSQHRPRPLQSEALDSLGCGLWFQPLHFLGDDLGSLPPCGDWSVGSPGGWGYTCTVWFLHIPPPLSRAAPSCCPPSTCLSLSLPLPQPAPALPASIVHLAKPPPRGMRVAPGWSSLPLGGLLRKWPGVG